MPATAAKVAKIKNPEIAAEFVDIPVLRFLRSLETSGRQRVKIIRTLRHNEKSNNGRK